MRSISLGQISRQEIGLNRIGLGLGPAVARGFTEANGGTLEVEDTPGGGLTMVFNLKIVSGETT